MNKTVSNLFAIASSHASGVTFFGISAFCLLLSGISNAASIMVEDDLNRVIALEQPAKKIISLAPHITENLFSAGAGEDIVGVVEYSDFPEKAKKIASIGSFSILNIERIIALNPDLIIAWHSGNGMSKIQQLIDLGFTVYISEPKTLVDIGHDIEKFGVLSGHPETAKRARLDYQANLAELNKKYSDKTRVRVFYEIWHQPMQTLNGKHLINDVIEICGGENIFAEAVALAPQVDIESIIAADPQVIIASSVADEAPRGLDDWFKWPSVNAVRNSQIYFINADYLERHTVRILQGAQAMCEQLELAREGQDVTKLN